MPIRWRNPGTIFKYHNIYAELYTKGSRTADQYIEGSCTEIGRRHHVTVATSDAWEQVIILLGQGGHRISGTRPANEILLAKQELCRKNIWKRLQKAFIFLMGHRMR